MLVESFMTRSVITTRVDEPVGSALQRMREEGLRRMPVMDGQGNLVGMVSDRRLLQALAVPVRRGGRPDSARDLPALTVGQVMNPEPLTIGPDATLEAAAVAMTDHRVGSLIVMRDGTPIGIITETDLFRVFLRLLVGEQGGWRVTLRVPAFRGILADITSEIARGGGNLLSLGTLTEEDEFLVSFNVLDLTRRDLEDILQELPVQVVDIRAT